MEQQEPRLREVEGKLDRLLVVVEEMSRRFGEHEVDQRRFRDDICRLLYGKGTEPNKGIVVRLDRLEQAQYRSSRLMWLVVGAGMAAAGAQFLG